MSTRSLRFPAVSQSLTKNSQALGEDISRTGFTSALCCSISTFRLRELTKSGASCWRDHIRTNQEIFYQYFLAILEKQIVHAPYWQVNIKRKEVIFILYLNINLVVSTHGGRWYFCLFCEEAFVVFGEQSSWRHSWRLQVSVQSQSVGYIWKKWK